MLDRRTFLQSLAVAASGLLVPERKVWALDQTMLMPIKPVEITTAGLVAIDDGDFNYYQVFDCTKFFMHFTLDCAKFFMHFTLAESGEPYIHAVDTEYWPPFLVPESARFDGFSLRGDIPV